MTHVVLEPGSNAEAQEHYRKTIESAVPLRRIRPHVDSESIERLGELYPNGAALIWGATPGTPNTGSVERMDVGDLVLFYRQREFISMTHVTFFDVGNRLLAVELWDANDEGETWEHVFFLDEPEPISLPYHELWEVAQFGAEDMLCGLTVPGDKM